jgi:PKD repeat protein
MMTLPAVVLLLLFMSMGCDGGGCNGTDPTPTPTPGPTPGPGAQVNVTIDTQSERTPISPYIYGVNQDIPGLTSTARRLGGNRLTAYNWEDNASNAGSDWMHSSDNYIPQSMGIDEADFNTPGIVATTFHEKTLTNKFPYSLITLQAAGYVSADKNGEVKEDETAPSLRWKKVVFAKNAEFALTPDGTDDFVYMDEYVHFLVNRFGSANQSSGIKGYSVDNEPGLWANTHPRVHPQKATCDEIIEQTTGLSLAVKNVDPHAEIFGPALYGFNAYMTFQNAEDWENAYRNAYKWFIDFYLERMKERSDSAGKRLLDVLDIHYYSEARGGGMRVTFGEDPTNTECNKARLQAPRTLWQGAYKEESWITQYTPEAFRPILPRIQESIDQYYPGTKLAVTEYDFGAGNSITGGIAQADTLGIFSKTNVYLATYWGSENKKYIASAMNLFTNYDSKGSRYGNVNVQCDVSDDDAASAYASIQGRNTAKAHVILLNKNYDGPTTFYVSLKSDREYHSATVWGFDRSSHSITRRVPVCSINDNEFQITMPALSAYHVVLNTEPVDFGDMNGDGRVNSRDVASMQDYLAGDGAEFPEQGDLNLDGAIDSEDLDLLERFISGEIDALPSPQIDVTAPVAALATTPTAAVTDESVTFDASPSVDEESGIAYYAWDFGDGKEATGEIVTHKFAQAGTYDVKLSVGNGFGLTADMAQTIVITSETGDNSKIGFEADIEGFYTGSPETAVLSLSKEKAFKGNASLEVKIAGAADGMSDAKIDSKVIPAGSTITFRIWVPSGAPISAIQAYCMPHNADWSDTKWNAKWGGYEYLTKDDWNEFAFVLPEDTNMAYAQQLGIQVQTSGEGAFTLYVDSIDW